MKKRSRIKRIIIVALAAVLTLSSTSKTVLAISAENLEKFAENNIMFYDPEEGKECKRGGTSTAVRTTQKSNGNTLEEKIWNYFVDSKIEGIYDNPYAIAAILGNFMHESGYNMFQDNGSYVGIMQLNISYRGTPIGQHLKDMITAELGKDYFLNYASKYGWWDKDGYPNTDNKAEEILKKEGLTDEQIDKALMMTLDWYVAPGYDGGNDSDVRSRYVNDYGQTIAKQKPVNTKTIYVKEGGGVQYLKDGEPVDPTDIKQLTELFNARVEISGVVISGTNERARLAEAIYQRMTSGGGTAVTETQISSDSTNGEVYQGARYTLTDDQKVRLLHVAVHENSSSLQAIKTELSQIANNSEVHFGRDAPEYYNGESLKETVKSGWYSVSREGGAYDDLTWAGWNDDGSAKHDSGFTPSQEQLAAIDEVLVNGNRTIPQTVREHTSSYKASNDGVEVTIKEDDKYDRTEFVRGKTLIEDNTSSSKWIFWSFADQDQLLGDPFGYYENQPPSGVPSYKTSNITEDCPDDGEGTMVLPEGGMTFEQAQAMAEAYTKESQPWNGDPYGVSPNDFPYSSDCLSSFSDYSGCIAKAKEDGCGMTTNCSEFSLYFVNRFTTIHLNGVNNGGVVVSSNLIPAGFIDGGHTPKAYAVFSRTTGEYGHTGVVVGFDGDTVITVEAGCPDWPAHADTHSMAEMTSGDYEYAYTDQFIIRTGGGGTRSGDSVLPIGDASDGEIFKDSTDIKCATGTVFIKSDQIVYREYGTININLCYLPNMRSSMWDDYKDPEGVTRPIVNSRVSGALYAAAQKYKDDHKGAEIMVNASFRDYYTQQRYYECLSASPQQTSCEVRGHDHNVSGDPTTAGWSNHGLGTALDVDDTDSAGNGGVYSWMDSNLPSFGFVRGNNGESWHINLLNLV